MVVIEYLRYLTKKAQSKSCNYSKWNYEKQSSKQPKTFKTPFQLNVQPEQTDKSDFIDKNLQTLKHRRYIITLSNKQPNNSTNKIINRMTVKSQN